MTKTISSSMIEQVRQMAAVLRDGGVVAYPTDTIYGLGADIYNDEAVRKIFSIKGRPLNLPLPILIDNVEQLAGLVSAQTAFSRALISRFWPGGLTVIFTKSPSLQSLALAGSDKIAVRIPNHPVACMLIRELDRPITGTSANLHTGRVTLTADEVNKQLGSQVDYVIEAGRCPGGKESTVVDVTLEPPAIVRQGTIPEYEIMAEYHKKGGR